MRFFGNPIVIILLIVVVLASTIVTCNRNWTAVHEDQVLILDAVKKTSGGETRLVSYYIYTDKGYFWIGGPVDADGTPYVWKIADNFKGKKVTVKYYAAGWYWIDAWMWYPTVYEMHELKQ
ncbi:MAG: hypothetical protein Q7R84_00390 [bacterium]|nr:hypothetical protein [bacterium]